MAPLSDDLRGKFEKAVINARDAAETAATTALTTYAVERDVAPTAFVNGQRKLRNGLRARARQLGNGDMYAGIPLLVEEIAYEQWHRMLFARFLAENDLLMHPEGASLTLQDCADIANEEGICDAWQVAVRYARDMLPGIFRADVPAAQVRFAPEELQQLERILANIPTPVFTSDDGLGWAYQFWQTRKKKEVNESGRKIGGADISPVTQLFTEDYMVQFLLHNSLGAWWAARHPESPLVRELSYLRRKDDSTPAAGAFPGWPEHAAEVTVIDPCCGSGHFLVAGFELLRRMRMEEEGLNAAAATVAVLRDNLFGLELDPRCTQLAAFALAFAAWKAAGYRPLPLPNIACSGTPLGGALEDWLKLAGDDPRLRSALARLHQLFKDAPDLGSLINPADVPVDDRMFSADYAEVAPLLERALSRERDNDPAAAVFGDAAQGVLRAARLLARKYTLVATNVPYLTRNKQGNVLMDYCAFVHPHAKKDLATAFVERCLALADANCTSAIVTPQNWLFLSSYKELRGDLLRNYSWITTCWLGPGAFETIGGEVVKAALLIFTNKPLQKEHLINGLDASQVKQARGKDNYLRNAPLMFSQQARQLRNPDYRISLHEHETETLLETFAFSPQGIKTGDDARYRRFHWEMYPLQSRWRFFASTVDETIPYGGRDSIIDWVDQGRNMARLQGLAAWNKLGVAVNQMGALSATLYLGETFDSNIGPIVPRSSKHLSALWAYCSSPSFNEAVRNIDKKMNVTNATLVKIPFDLEHWQRIAEEAGPLPEPFSSDPTQWLFKGLPAESSAPLQVAVAKLVGYRWPAEDQEQADSMGVTVSPDERRLLRTLGERSDMDGIVCIPSVSRETPAHERLRGLLALAYGDAWSVAQQNQLLAQVGFAGKPFEAWLRDGFFEQHCRMFHNRPFVWQIWDGLRDGFAALVNYHRLDAANLDKLSYTYLGEWLRDRRAERDAGMAGAEARLLAAEALQKKLVAIRTGEPPYDIYVRWKPLAEQAIGWNPDLNDGVRLNIRPFVEAGILRNKFTINWNKDRGANPDGSERHNERYLTIAEKRQTRSR